MQTNRTHRGLAAALLATPVLWVVAEVVSPPLRSDGAAQLAVIAREPDRWYWYTILLIAGMITLVPAAFAVARVTADRTPRLASFGAALVSLSAIIGAGDAITQLLTWQMAMPGADRTQMAALLERFDNAAGASLVFLPGMLALLIGGGLLTAALVRSRAVPAWAAAGLEAAFVVNIVGFMSASTVVVAASGVLLLPVAVLVARRLAGVREPRSAVSVAPVAAS
ncbi:MAG TPA: hypothetical protein VHO27_07860 [Angustibacter sp.]|nr:hypothetical protein [Angustibacter sp.]